MQRVCLGPETHVRSFLWNALIIIIVLLASSKAVLTSACRTSPFFLQVCEYSSHQSMYMHIFKCTNYAMKLLSVKYKEMAYPKNTSHTHDGKGNFEPRENATCVYLWYRDILPQKQGIFKERVARSALVMIGASARHLLEEYPGDRRAQVLKSICATNRNSAWILTSRSKALTSMPW